MRRKIVCSCVPFVVAVALVVFAASSVAAVTFTGEVHSPTSVTGGGAWINPGVTSLSWIVSQNQPGGLWNYSYTLSVPQGPIVHWILELTPGVTLADIINITPNVQTQVRLFAKDDPTTPGMPGSIYGIDFQNVNRLSQTFTFQSAIAPVWGDFYARDGVAGGRDNFAFNTTFTDPDPTAPPSGDALNCKILRPDKGPGPVVPEPSSIMLGVIGLLPFIAAGRKLRKS